MKRILKSKAKSDPIKPDVEKMQLAIAEIAAESWRFKLALNKALKKMDVMDAERFSRQYDYFESRVTTAMSMANLTILDLTGQAYDVGLPIQAMNLDEFDEDEPLIVSQTIEPVIMMEGRVIKTGMVMVSRQRD